MLESSETARSWKSQPESSAALHHGQVAAAQEALAVGQGESGAEFVALFAFPRVADLRAADLVLV